MSQVTQACACSLRQLPASISSHVEASSLHTALLKHSASMPIFPELFEIQEESLLSTQADMSETWMLV